MLGEVPSPDGSRMGGATTMKTGILENSISGET